jgi:putative tricarboxylic transport membrane protein
MRAAAQNPESARLVGVRVSWMLGIGWGLAAAIGAIAGMMVAPIVFLDPNMMGGILLYGFAAALLGGIDNPWGAVIGGFIVGVLPGAGSSIASFISDGVEKAVSRHPEKFGTGVPEGVAAPEGANNADSGGAMVPLLTLGIPGGGSTAILLSALVVWGVKPGPLMMTESPEIFWGLIASLYLGSVMLLVMNLPMVPLFAQILRIPVYVLFPMIFGLALVGAFGVSDNPVNLMLLAGFGLLGYVMVLFGFPPAPLILGFVLGDAMERAVRQSLTMSMGDPTILVERPLSAVMLALALLVLLSPILSRLLRRRSVATAS